MNNHQLAGNVEGTSNVGGLIGYNYIYHTYSSNGVSYSMYIKKSYAAGNVTGTGNNVGGLVGYQQSNILAYNYYDSAYNYIQECYATGNVTTTGNNVGGLVRIFTCI